MSNVHEWRTSVTHVTEADIFVRGLPIQRLINERDFVEVAFLTLRGRFPEQRERRMMDAALISLVDHGFVSAHVAAARFIISGNPSVVAGLAGGVLTAGPNTLSPETAAGFIDHALAIHRQRGGTYEETARAIVADAIAHRLRIPGFGHVTHKTEDPRTRALRELAEELGWVGDRVRLYEAIHQEFVAVKNRHLPINADGMLAAILGEMGWSPAAMSGLAVFAALPGMLAHVIEELTDGAPHRFIPEEQVVYTGSLEAVDPRDSKS